MSNDSQKLLPDRVWESISPLTLVLLAVNAVIFGGCIVFLATGAWNGPLVLLTIGTGLTFGAKLAQAIKAVNQVAKNRPAGAQNEQP